MKAIKINEEIKVYSKLPNSWKGVMGNFSMLSEEEIKAYGFYDVVIPDYDPVIQDLSDIFWQEANQVFTYNVLNKTWAETLNELKENKLNHLKEHTNSLLGVTDWYYIRKLQRDINVPEEIKNEREAILSNHNDHETAINALTEKADVIKYEFR
tara:strand:+ start:644 stop:1105 length:462 start_codon:yes stop_codon:yes gene_type:complete